MRPDLIAALFLFAAAIFFCIESVPLGLGNLRNPGAGFIPFLSAILLGCLSLANFFSKLREKKRARFGSGEDSRNGVWVLICLFFYLLFLNKLGFIVTTFVFLILLLLTFKPRRWFGILLVSVLTVFFSYLIFVYFLGVTMPQGVFSF